MKLISILISLLFFSNFSFAKVEVAFSGNSSVAAISLINSTIEGHIRNGGMLRKMTFWTMSSSAGYCFEIRDEGKEYELAGQLHKGLSTLWNPQVGDPRESPGPGSVLIRAEVLQGDCQ